MTAEPGKKTNWVTLRGRRHGIHCGPGSDGWAMCFHERARPSHVCSAVAQVHAVFAGTCGILPRSKKKPQISPQTPRVGRRYSWLAVAKIAPGFALGRRALRPASVAQELGDPFEYELKDPIRPREKPVGARADRAIANHCRKGFGLERSGRIAAPPARPLG